MQTVDNNDSRRTIFILSIPGGGMLGIIPAVVLARLEQLTETPSIDLFQVIEAGSTGSILAMGLNAAGLHRDRSTDFSARNIAEMYCRFGPEFFPDIPARGYKMSTSHIMSVIEDYTDPLRVDAQIIKHLKQALDDLKNESIVFEKSRIEDLEKISTSRWLTSSNKKKGLELCTSLASSGGATSEIVMRIGELLFQRQTTGLLGRAFRTTVMEGIGAVRQVWARDFMYDATKAERTYKKLFGDVRMKDCVKSTYVSAFNLSRGKAWTFFNRKADFFDSRPDPAADVSRHNHRQSDVIMASTAHPFAYLPHRTEDGDLFSDKSLVHTPEICVRDVLKRKPSDADVRLVILGTGKFLTQDQDNDPLSEYQRYGLLGNILRGRELSDLNNFTMSEARQRLRAELGKDNIIEFVPRLAPHNSEEARIFPRRDILDASSDNIRRILNRAVLYLQEEDQNIRRLARDLAENLYNIGQMNKEKFERVIKKIECDDCVPPVSVPEQESGSLLHIIPEGLHALKESLLSLIPHGTPASEQDNRQPDSAIRKKSGNGPRPAGP